MPMVSSTRVSGNYTKPSSCSNIFRSNGSSWFSPGSICTKPWGRPAVTSTRVSENYVKPSYWGGGYPYSRPWCGGFFSSYVPPVRPIITTPLVSRVVPYNSEDDAAAACLCLAIGAICLVAMATVPFCQFREHCNEIGYGLSECHMRRDCFTLI